MRDDFNPKTINTLSRRAGFRCSNPYCRKVTVGSHENKDKSTLVGVAAHITAASPGGARYDSSWTLEQRSSIDNGIWLCVNCSTLIDKDPTKFPVKLLIEWKSNIDKESADELLKSSSSEVTLTAVEEKVTKPTLEERAERAKELRKKQFELEAFLRSRDALDEAKNQVVKIIAKVKTVKATLDDRDNGFILATISRNDDMYGIGFKRKYVCFNWARPDLYDLNQMMLKVSLLERDGVWEFDVKETPKIIVDYKYTRDLNGTDGWVDFKTHENFICTSDLVDKWIEDFLEYIDYK